MNKHEVLKKYFGFDNFVSLQEEAIDQILQHKDLLTILPTGSGKSIIFQVPSMMMDGVTIVISPLVALMQDQVMNLNANGISASSLNSLNSHEQNNAIIEDAKNTNIKFLYLAPERFTDEYFLNQLRQININFFVIDEAHCVSEWGHEFRDDYRKLKHIKDNFANTAIAAFTATATSSVQKDILSTLKIPFENSIKGKIQRKNLIIRSQRRQGNGRAQIKEFLNTHKDECGIIYCFTRKETETLSSYLNSQGFQTLAYHAGINANLRNEIFTKFKNEQIKIIVATIAFGMGIDKGNIRFVLHTSMPKTLENYSQEIGRAGRDGLNSDVLMLYSKADEISKKVFIDNLPNGVYKDANYDKLSYIYKFCISDKCRHKLIAKYFDDDIDDCESICDNCLDDDKQYIDISIDAQKFISTILRTGERFGQNYIIDVLRGSKQQKILDFSHDKLSVYGIGEHFSKEQWTNIADALFDADAIIIKGEFRTVQITSKAREILTNKRKVQINKDDLIVSKSYSQYKQTTPTNETYESFKNLRIKLAKQNKIAPYMVFSDKTLIDISNTLPTSPEEFLQISGIGQQKLDSFGELFMNMCKDYKNQGINTTRVLSKTYLQTLDLINDNLNVKEISNNRDLKDMTILNHIKELAINSYINNEKKDILIEPYKNSIPNELEQWIKEGLSKHDIQDLKKYLNLYDFLNNI